MSHKCLTLFLLTTLLFGPQACQRGEGSASSVSGKANGKFSHGKSAPAFFLSSISGEKMSLYKFRDKVVLINFWATWCAPCVAEMPSLERIYQQFKDRGFEIVSINVDPPTAAEDVKRFVKENGLSFEVLLDPDLSLPPDYGVTGFPESFFVDPKGQFISFLDPEAKEKAVRIVSDRAWDSPAFTKAIDSLLGMYGK